MKPVQTLVFSLFAFGAAAHAQTHYPQKIAAEMMRLNGMVLLDKPASPQASYKPVHAGSLWDNLRQNFRMQEVNSSIIRSHERKFASQSAYFNRVINRSRPYMYHITNEVLKRGMPAEIALLPFIESAYVTKARSHVGASGLWQFMPATGRQYGLQQNHLYDDRHDIYAATDAALNYLQYLYGLFGDWSLALAAYNWGEGNVSRAIRNANKAGLPATYENLKMPNETRNYVPKLLAVRNLVNQPQAFGIALPDIKHAPYFKAISINNPLDIRAAANLANISESEFLDLNPALKTPVFLPNGNRKLLLPVAAAQTFERNYNRADSQQLLSWDIFTPYTDMSLSEIAEQTGTDIADLRRLNGISGNSVSAGTSVLVNKSDNNAKAAVNFARALPDETFIPKPAAQPGLAPLATHMPVQTAFNNITVNTISVSPVTDTPAPVKTTGTQPGFAVAPVTHSVPVTPVVAAAAPVVQATQPVQSVQPAPVVQATPVIPSPIVISQSASAVETHSSNNNDDPLFALAQASANRLDSQTATPSSVRTHLVSSGDTLYNIAQRYQIGIDTLMQQNQLHDNTIRIGQTLIIQP